MKNLIINIFFLLAIISYVLSQTKEEKKQLKAEQEVKESKITTELINSGSFQFEATWATTQKGRRINLIGNPNYLKLNNNEADVDLPFFGEAFSGSIGISGDGGIVFKGTPENYKTDFNDKKQKHTIEFKGKGKNDTYDFSLTVFKNGNANLTVNSNNRSSISYDGKILELEKK